MTLQQQRKSSWFTSVIGGFFTLLALFTLCFGLLYYLFQTKPIQTDLTITITKGSGFFPNLKTFHTKKIFPHPWITAAYYIAFNKKPIIMAGTYTFKENQTLADIIQMMRYGDVEAFKITFPEGLTSHAIVKKLNEAPFLEGHITTIPPEGSLMPDTYTYTHGTHRKNLLKQMTKQMQSYMHAKFHLRSNSALKTPDEIITLASLIEKESTHSEELGRIAGVYMNRLTTRMRLQSDPTVIYAITSGQQHFNRKVTFDDLKIQSPFNTYRNDGLPPTPICCPGRAAIDAALHPHKTHDKFFVKVGNTHEFSKTFSEHKLNIQKQKKLNLERRVSK